MVNEKVIRNNPAASRDWIPSKAIRGQYLLGNTRIVVLVEEEAEAGRMSVNKVVTSVPAMHECTWSRA
jgi:hypothetical protein